MVKRLHTEIKFSKNFKRNIIIIVACTMATLALGAAGWGIPSVDKGTHGSQRQILSQTLLSSLAIATAMAQSSAAFGRKFALCELLWT